MERFRKFTLWPERVTNKYQVKKASIAKIISAIWKNHLTRCQWLIPEILATKDAEIKRIIVQIQSQQNNSYTIFHAYSM
jgi:hypothetical protein